MRGVKEERRGRREGWRGMRSSHGDSRRAADLYLEALDISLRWKGVNHADLADLLYNLAALYASVGDRCDALSFLSLLFSSSPSLLQDPAFVPSRHRLLHDLHVPKVDRWSRATAGPLFQRAAQLHASKYGWEHELARDAKMKASKCLGRKEEDQTSSSLMLR